MTFYYPSKTVETEEALTQALIDAVFTWQGNF